jgi:hypothetical protein
MQLPLAVEPEKRPDPSLVTTVPSFPSCPPVQLPLIRMLEMVRDRVDSIHAGQRTLTVEVREIQASLPRQGKPL